jgi:hypothetical protein
MHEAEMQSHAYMPDKHKIRCYLKQNMDIKNKNLYEQKNIIQAYIKKIYVHEKTIKITSIVDTDGGGEGNRSESFALYHAGVGKCSPAFPFTRSIPFI